jgi:hypothetical protein
MKKLELAKETLRVLTHEQLEAGRVAGGKIFTITYGSADCGSGAASCIIINPIKFTTH